MGGFWFGHSCSPSSHLHLGYSLVPCCLYMFCMWRMVTFLPILFPSLHMVDMCMGDGGAIIVSSPCSVLPSIFSLHTYHHHFPYPCYSLPLSLCPHTYPILMTCSSHTQPCPHHHHLTLCLHVLLCVLPSAFHTCLQCCCL